MYESFTLHRELQHLQHFTSVVNSDMVKVLSSPHLQPPLPAVSY